MTTEVHKDFYSSGLWADVLLVEETVNGVQKVEIVARKQITDLGNNKILREGYKADAEFKIQLPSDLLPSLYVTQQNSLEKVMIDSGQRFVCAQVYYVLRVQYLPSEEAIPDDGSFFQTLKIEDLWEDFQQGLSKFSLQQIILIKNEKIEMPAQQFDTKQSIEIPHEKIFKNLFSRSKERDSSRCTLMLPKNVFVIGEPILVNIEAQNNHDDLDLLLNAFLTLHIEYL